MNLPENQQIQCKEMEEERQRKLNISVMHLERGYVQNQREMI